jgi:hypothetical protein
MPFSLARLAEHIDRYMSVQPASQRAIIHPCIPVVHEWAVLPFLRAPQNYALFHIVAFQSIAAVDMKTRDPTRAGMFFMVPSFCGLL